MFDLVWVLVLAIALVGGVRMAYNILRGGKVTLGRPDNQRDGSYSGERHNSFPDPGPSDDNRGSD